MSSLHGEPLSISEYIEARVVRGSSIMVNVSLGSDLARITLQVECSPNSPRSPKVIEITISLKLCEVDSLDLLDVLRAN